MMVRLQIAITASLLLFSSAAAAQQSVCVPGNLLARATPLRQQRASKVEKITDGAVPSEGDFWNTPHTALLHGGDSFLDYDLGQVTGINAIYLQGDNNDTYQLHGSLDGRSFTPIWTAPIVNGVGMRRRMIENLGVEARYLRVGFGQGDGYFSIGELQVFCQKPAAWPPRSSRRLPSQRRPHRRYRRRGGSTPTISLVCAEST